MGATQSRVGTRFGKYQLDRLLGRGGMGEVYQAVDTEKGRTVALKILLAEFSADPDYRQRFTREANAAAQLQEPHVIPIHDWGEIDGCLYIDMRMVDGVNLRDLLANGPLDPVRAVNICGQVAGALDAAHAHGVVHRDIKPANVVVADGDFAYLLDFGIAEQAGDTRLTRTGMTVGSMAYIAPERLSDAKATASVDVYGLTCVLFECLTGRAPFVAESMAKVMSEHLHARPPAPSAVNPRVPAGFDEVIARGMAKDPDDRYGSAGALARAAQRALSAQAQVAAASAYPTAAAPHVQAGTDVYTRHAPPSGPIPVGPPSGPLSVGPSSGPFPAAPSAPQSGPPGWLVPTLIAVAVALLAVVGVTLGVLIGKNSGSDNAAVGPSTPQLSPSPRVDRSVTTPATTASRPPAPPPGVRGPDGVGALCNDGFVRPPGTAFASHAVRGSTAASCYFTQNTLDAYWAAGPPDRGSRVILVAGAVPCEPGRAACRNGSFVMECAMDGPNEWIACSGGHERSARVLLY